jgi:hypothetical protein
MIRITDRRAPVSLGVAMFIAVCSACSHIPPAAEPEVQRAELETNVRALLAAYAANDQTGVLRFADPQELTVFGSDIAELIRTPGQLRRLMDDDFAVWHFVRFGEIRDLDIRISNDLATAYFHVPFSVGGRAELIVRFATTWRRRDGGWKLTQAANTVPTVGSSARELADKATPPKTEK